MKLINPQFVTEAQLFASNVPEDDAPVWVAGTNYAIGDQVIYEHRIYEALAVITGADNLIDPATGALQDPPIWLDLGATNRFRMFDGIVDSGTSQTGTIEVTLRMGELANGVAFFNLLGSTLNVQVDDPVDGIVYDRDFLLQDNSAITSWYAYFFEPIVQRPDVVLTDLPQYRDADILVTVDAGAATARVGEMVVGRVRQLGVTNYGTSVSIQDYSRKERDQFGNTIIVQRRFSKRADFDVTVETSQVFAVQAALAAIRTMPTVYIGDEDKPASVIYGFFRQFNIVYDTPSISSCSIEVEGLV